VHFRSSKSIALSLFILAIPCRILPAAQESEVTGRVVEAGSGVPVPQARVALLRTKANSIQWNSNWTTQPIREDSQPNDDLFLALTGPDGLFRFKVSTPGYYLPLATAAGYIAKEEPIDLSKVLKLDGAGTAPAVTLQLERESWITGRVFDDRNGKPAPAMVVTCFRWRRNQPAPVRATTDAQGYYSIGPLRSGQYGLQVTPPSTRRVTPLVEEADTEEAETGLAETFYPGIELRTGAAPITVFPGSRLAKMDIRMKPVRLGSVRVAMTAPGAPGQSGFDLHLFENRSSDLATQYESLVETTAAEGLPLMLRGVAPGDYTLCAYSKKSTALEPRSACTRVPLVPGAREHVVLAILPGMALRGRVLLAGSERPPLQGSALLTLRPVGRPSLWWESPTPVQLASGFEAVNVPAGLFDVELRGLPEGLVLAGLLVNGAPLAGRRVDLSTGSTKSTLDLVLMPPASVRITMKRGKEDSGTWIVAVAEHTPQDRLFQECRVIKSGPDGLAELRGLAPGRYRLIAFAPGAASVADLPVAERLAAALTVKLEPAVSTSVEMSTR